MAPFHSPDQSHLLEGRPIYQVLQQRGYKGTRFCVCCPFQWNPPNQKRNFEKGHYWLGPHEIGSTKLTRQSHPKGGRPRSFTLFSVVYSGVEPSPKKEPVRKSTNVDPGLLNPSHYWGGVPSNSDESPTKRGHPPINQPGLY